MTLRKVKNENQKIETSNVSLKKVILVGILTGFLLNLTGWLGNNFLLGSMWKEVGEGLAENQWRASIWRDVFSFVPDYVYGFAIAWLLILLNNRHGRKPKNALVAGIYVSIVGGIVAYFGIANSGFIPWDLAIASFGLVLITKIPLSYLAYRLLR